MQIVLLCILLSALSGRVYAQETQIETYVEELNLQSVQQSVDEMLPQDHLDIRNMVLQLCQGKVPFSLENVWKIMENTLFSEMNKQRTRIVQILILAIAASVFSNFMGAFSENRIQEIAFYMVYLLLLTFLLESFGELSQAAEKTMGNILEFMRLLLPVYLLAASLAAKQLTAVGFYEVTLFLITMVQSLIQYVLLPGINCYVMLAILNNVTRESYLSRMTELLKDVVTWILRSLFALVIGVQTIQKLIFPALDTMKNSIWIKAGGAIPVVGNTLSGVTETILSTAAVLKNAVGAGGMLVLVYICIRPVLRLMLCLLLYKLAGAVIQPVADPRFAECIDKMADAVALLLMTVAVTGVMFFLTIAIVTTAGGVV